MKYIFIVNGKAATGKSLLFRKAMDVDLSKITKVNDINDIFYINIKKSNIKTVIIDDFVYKDNEDIMLLHKKFRIIY